MVQTRHVRTPVFMVDYFYSMHHHWLSHESTSTIRNHLNVSYFFHLLMSNFLLTFLDNFNFETFVFWNDTQFLMTSLKVNESQMSLSSFHRYCTVTVQYWCSVSKAKYDRAFSVALLNCQKIPISLQLPDRDFTRRVPSTSHWTLQELNLIFSFVKLLLRP